MIAALTLLIGFQLLLSFLNYDISSSPREPLHPMLRRHRQVAAKPAEAPAERAPGTKRKRTRRTA
jgi:hypothetical protein